MAGTCSTAKWVLVRVLLLVCFFVVLLVAAMAACFRFDILESWSMSCRMLACENERLFFFLFVLVLLTLMLMLMLMLMSLCCRHAHVSMLFQCFNAAVHT